MKCSECGIPWIANHTYSRAVSHSYGGAGMNTGPCPGFPIPEQDSEDRLKDQIRQLEIIVNYFDEKLNQAKEEVDKINKLRIAAYLELEKLKD
jgi:hypothetical protein